MEANLHRELDIALIAGHVGLAPSTFWNLWRWERDDCPARLLKLIRIEHAKRLLFDRDLLVKEIAAAVGVPSVSGFIRMFQVCCGETPQNFRRRTGMHLADGTEMQGNGRLDQ
jgi:two-component system response regulator YesN